MTILQRFRRYFIPYRSILAASIVFGLAGNLAKAAGPIVLQRAIDQLTGSISNSALIQYGAVIISVALVQGMTLFLQERLWNGVAYRVECDLRLDFYAHLQKQPPQFFQENRIGDLMARATNDLSTIAFVAGPVLIALTNAIFALGLIIPSMARLNWRLTLLSILPLLLMMFTGRFFMLRIRSRFERVQSYFGEMCNQTEEVFAGVRTIRAYTQEQPEMEKFRAHNQRYRALNLNLIKLQALLNPFLQFLVGLSFLAVLWYGGVLALGGHLSIGQLIEFAIFISYLVWSAYTLGSVTSFSQRLLASLNRIHSVMSLEPAIADPPDIIEMKRIEGEIELRHVTFTYPGADTPALHEINLRVAPGETVALVGAVGAGKSTLLNLIPRLLEATSGTVLIDGRPISQIPLKVLRSSLGYAPQESFLFSDTITNNIAFGAEDATAEQIEIAAVQAGLTADIERFPARFETHIGQHGVTLSGGQRQRLAIARALIRNARIVLLDDALSSVDADTEACILNELQKFMPGRTCLISSHRISTIRFADVIVVLDRGRIRERGTHKQLLARGGFYAELYERQLLEDELAAR
jgi:ATP-binding cassette, subfamily B, multidrug efflux pump